MTRDEFAALRVGDRVECRIDDAWHFCEVVEPPREVSGGRRGGKLYVSVRRLGSMGGGRKWPSFCRGEWQAPARIRATAADVVTCNVYADFLDEQGYVDAAAALRRAFPLGDDRG